MYFSDQLTVSDVIEISETETRMFHENRLTRLENKLKDAKLEDSNSKT